MGTARRIRALAVVSPLLVAGVTCAAPPRSETRRVPAVAPRPEELAPGVVSREDVEAFPKWQHALRFARPDANAARALRDVPAGGAVRVLFGSWCGDSRRELARFWRALDAAGGAVPFTIELVAVGRDKTVPAGLDDDVPLLRVPTFVVVRAGKELGRVIESASPAGIESDLGQLLRGERTGVVSGRPDLAP